MSDLALPAVPVTDAVTAPVTLVDHFCHLPDPRVERTRLHSLLDILVIALCATLAGAETFNEIEEFGQARHAWLKERLDLPNGIPSHDTFARVFARLDPNAFRDCFGAWVQALHHKTDGQVIALDGKCLRGSFDTATGKSALYMVSAWAAEQNLVLGQVPVDQKSNEITALPKLLALLDVSGCIVTVDAMGTQKDIARQIIAQEGDYVLALKQNHPVLYEDVTLYLEWARQNHFKSTNGTPLPHSFCQTFDADHGRLETRRCWCVDKIDWLDGKDQWAGLASIAVVECERRPMDGSSASVERRYFLSSLPADAPRILHAVRSHWGIENSLHWSLDVAMHEDASRIHKDHAPENMAVLRHIVLNLLKRDTNANKSLRRKRLAASWDINYLERLLTN